MRLPRLNVVNKSQVQQIEFRGLNHNYYVGENEFYDMQNLTSEYYPVLSPRQKRVKYTGNFEKINGITSLQGKLCMVDKTRFLYNGTQYGTVTDSPKQFALMGAYIAVFPDKKLFNTESLAWEDMGALFTTTDDVHYAITTRDGDNYTVKTVGAIPPQNPENGEYWINTADVPHVLKQYSETTGMWVSVPTVYTKISSAGIGTKFSAFDGVTVSGSTVPQCNGDFVLQAAGENYIIIVGLLDETTTQDTPITIERKVPNMDYVCEMNNRIWGCSSENHEIYACKLGDPKNWYSYAGISTDSYAVTVGSDGDFTGCVSHLGYVLFFKEDIIHKIYGSKPSNFQITDTHCRGVEKGSEKSLCVVNETLYYKSRDGIMCYDGSLPVDISHNLGKGIFKNASAGSIGNRYFVSMQENGEYQLYVYDEAIQLWHREDNTRADYFVRVGNALYMANEENLMGINGSSLTGLQAQPEENVSWYAQTGEILYYTTDRKYVSRLNFRVALEPGSTMAVSVQYDNDAWDRVYELTASVHRTYLIPIIPRRSDVIRIKISGTGNGKIFAFTKILERGSDI